MNIYYKATRPDGTDFHSGTVDYGAALVTGEVLRHPAEESLPGDSSTYFSVATDPVGTLLGGTWPCRLFRVEPEGGARSEEGTHRFKSSCSALRVSGELDPSLVFGPQGAEVAEFIRRIPAARNTARNTARRAAYSAAWYAAHDAAGSVAQGAAWSAARRAARNVAWGAARSAAWGAAGSLDWGTARSAAWGAAGSAAVALVVRDLITPSEFDALTAPWKILTGEDS